MRSKFYPKKLVRVFNGIRIFCLLMLAISLSNFSTQAQCTNTSSFATVTAPSPGATVTITTCSFAGEFSTINSATAATSYTVTSSIATDFITIHQGTSGGPVIAFGVTPLTWSSTVAGTYFAHWNTSAACGSQSTCRTTTITNNTPPPNPCASILPLACLTPTTATLAGSGGGWSPGSCGFTTPGAEQVYSYTPALSGMHTLNVTTGTGGFVDYFFKDATGGCSSTGWTCISDISSSGTVTFGPLTAGTQYYLLLDAEGTTSRTHTFNIVCPTPCTVTCPANITVNVDPNQCGAVVTYPAPTTSGSCGTVTTSPASGSFFPKGTTTVTATSSIGGGTCSFTITVVDNQVPTITCPANITRSNDAGQCGAIVTFAAPTASDNCPGVTVTSSPASGSLFPVGTTTVTNTATDAAGNIATCTFTVRVNDTQAPTITCPANIVVSNTANQCGAIVNFTPVAADNCPIGTSTPVNINQSSSAAITTFNSVSCNSGGLHTDNSYWRAYDLAPLALVGPYTINRVRFGIETATASGVTQPVNVRIYAQTTGTFPAGTRTLVRSQTFNIPNQAATIFSANLTSPVTVPANAVVILELNTPDGQVAGNSFFIGSNTAAETGPSYISAADCAITTPTDLAAVGFPNMNIILAADGTVPVPGSGTVSVPASGSFFAVGTTTVTSTATDGAGNTASCTFTVRVNDTQAPVITCPANITVTTAVGLCTAPVTYAVTATDNCPGVVTALTAGLASGTNFPIGVTTVTYRATDVAGNISTCSFTVTVLDGQLPVIGTQPVNRTVCTGTNAVFSVTSGNAVSYQWQQFIGGVWTNIAGATGSSLTLNGVTVSMNDNSYRVNVIGLCTTVTSGFASLYVNPLPVISLTASNAPVLLPGQTTSITANVNPTGGSFVWFKNGAALVPAVTGGTLSNLAVENTGTYRAVYTDLNGCVNTSGDLVVSAEPSDRLYIAPNPNFGQFSVRYYNQLNEQLTLTVFNSNGARVYQKSVTTTLAYTRMDIDLGLNAPGVYVVQLHNSAGKLLGSKQIIVSHR